LVDVPNGDITALLRRWKDGDEQARDQLVPYVYPHLHTVAIAYIRGESPNQTLQPTALVNELYLRLVQQRQPNLQDRSHFYALAASLMRRVLTDHARASQACKRGSGLVHVPLSDEIAWVNVNGETLLDLNRALEELERLDPRKVRLVELRYFLGCTVPEAASFANTSVATAERDLALARAWLYLKLQGRKDSSGTQAPA
jgi:RNA polymerase sigma factor (TIGR02999 family)